MNRLLTFPGQQPIYLGDIDFMQDSVKNAFRQLLVALTGSDTPNCILKTATAEQDGVICLDGEIMPYKAYQGTMIGAHSYKVVSSYSGSRTFKNGEVHDCYEERYAEESLGGMSLPTLDSLLSSRMRFPKRAIVLPVDNSEASISAIRIGASVLLELSIKFTSSLTTEYLVNQSYMPFSVSATAPKYCVAGANIGGSLKTLPAEVTIDGESLMTVRIPQTSFSAGDQCTLNLSILL